MEDTVDYGARQRPEGGLQACHEVLLTRALESAFAAEVLQQLSSYQSRSMDRITGQPSWDGESSRLQLQLDSTLKQYLDPDQPGAAVMVVKDGKVMYSSAVGKADMETDRPITMTDRFDLASVSKQFTAMAIMMLAERGELNLDDDIRDFFPELKTRHRITVAHLLNMTAGLPEYTTDPNLPNETTTNQDVLDHVNRKGLVSYPGEKFQYTNTNYVLLSMIVERTTGREFKEFLQSEIFDRLGMNSTAVTMRGDQDVPDRVTGYEQSPGARFAPVRSDSLVTGDGEMTSTVGDLTIWDQELNHPTLVSKEMLERAWQSGRLNNGKETGYGFGWEVGKERGHKIVEHDGSWDGTSTYIRRDLETGITVIVLSNRGDFNVRGLGHAIAATLRGSRRSN